MADNFGSFYSGDMAPPLRLPDGSYIPAPAAGSPMSVPQMYDGIYGGAASGLRSVSRPTVAINPTTGMPYATTASARVAGGGGIGAGGGGQVRYSAPVYQPNGTVVENKSQARLPITPVGMPLTAPLASARGQLGASGFGSGSLTAKMPSAPSTGVINLVSEPMSEVSGQNAANSFGKPVRGPSGKTYYPSNVPQSGVRPPYDPAGAAKYSGKAQPSGTKSGGGWMSLLGSMLNGANAPRAASGLVPGVGSAASAPALGYNAAFAQSAPGDGQGNNGISGDGHWGGARSLTS